MTSSGKSFRIVLAVTPDTIRGYDRSGIAGLILSRVCSWDVIDAIAETRIRTVVIDTPDGSVPASHLIRQALDFIRERAAEGISPADVAKHLRVSHRLVELRFRELCSKTIAETIRDRRLELASEALLASDSPVGEIVAGCGFRTRRVLERLFRARYGMSMLALPGRTQDAARPEAARPQFRGQDARAPRRAKTQGGLSFFASMG